MKAAETLCFLSLIGVTAGVQANAQVRNERSRQARQGKPQEASSQTVNLHNPYTGGAVSGELLLPARARPIASAILLTGPEVREERAAGALGAYLRQRGYAVLSLPPAPASGATEEDNLNAVAALHYLQTRAELQGAPAGVIGYGGGVRLAAVAAAEGNSAAFLVLLGGEVVPDRLNTLPDNLAHASLPKDEAARSLQRLHCPVLALIGEYDRQGTHRNASENNQALKAALDTGKNENYTIKVLNDSDMLLADTGPAGAHMSATALPPGRVWATVADWIGRQAPNLDRNASDITENPPQRPVRLYPKSVYGPFPFRPSYIWGPSVGDQPRPFGYWYW